MSNLTFGFPKTSSFFLGTSETVFSSISISIFDCYVESVSIIGTRNCLTIIKKVDKFLLGFFFVLKKTRKSQYRPGIP